MSCADHDQNIDALLDRRNHTGTQSANTIHDLKVTVLNWPEIEELMASGQSLTASLAALRDEVFSPTGHVQQTVNALEARLNSALSSEVSRLNALSAQLTALTSRVDNLSSQLQSQQSSVSALGDRISINDADNQALWNAIGGRDSMRLLLPQPRWKGMTPGSSNILFLQYDTLANVVFWSPPPVINAGWVGSYKFDLASPGFIDFGELGAP